MTRMVLLSMKVRGDFNDPGQYLSPSPSSFRSLDEVKTQAAQVSVRERFQMAYTLEALHVYCAPQ